MISEGLFIFSVSSSGDGNFHHFCHRLSDIGRTLHNMNAALIHDLHLGGGGVISSADNGASVSHTPTRGRSLTCNKSNNRFFVSILFDPAGGFSLHPTADLTNHQDAVSVLIVHEQFHSVSRTCTDDRVAPDAECRRYSQAS